MSKTRSKNPILIRPGITIGDATAEHDDLLSVCFQATEIYKSLQDRNDKRFILKGRTGSGKTAFLKRLEEDHGDQVIRVDPDELSLTYISNSDVIQYLQRSGIDLNPFFQIIWNHAFATKLIKRRYNIDSTAKANTIINTLQNTLNPARRKALDYLRSFPMDLWPEFQRRVTTVTTRIEDELRGQFEANVPPVKLSGSGKEVLSRKLKRP